MSAANDDNFDVFAELATDPALEENGAWFDLNAKSGLLVARSDNKAYSKALTKAIERHKEALGLEDEAADKLSDAIMIDVCARTLLLGWKKISFKGAELAYSVENAKMILEVKDFRKKVMAFANSFEAYKVKQEVVQGNG